MCRGCGSSRIPGRERVVARLGDCRSYRWRHGGLHPVSAYQAVKALLPAVSSPDISRDVSDPPGEPGIGWAEEGDGAFERRGENRGPLAGIDGASFARKIGA